MHVDAAVGVAEADFDSARIVEAAAVEAEVVFQGLEDELALVERGFWFARHIVVPSACFCREKFRICRAGKLSE